VALTYLLLVGFGLFFLHPKFLMVGIVDQSRIVAPERIKTRTDETLSDKHMTAADLALNRSAAGLSFGFSSSFLRFDFKQNLHTWPVVATGIERSPPSV
jgi:hypothetical protein